MSDEPGNGVRITNKEIWLEVRELAEIVRPLADLPKRVRKLEFRYYGLIAGLVGAVVILIKGLP